MSRLLNPTAFTFAALVALASAVPAHAFKVSNDVPDGVAQISTGNLVRGFSAQLKNGESSACHWSERSCNPGGGQAEFDVSVVTGNAANTKRLVCGQTQQQFKFVPGVPMQAGASMRVKRDGAAVYVLVFNLGNTSSRYDCVQDPDRGGMFALAPGVRIAPGTNPSTADIAEAQAMTAQRDGAAHVPGASRLTGPTNNQICVGSPQTVRAQPFWTWKGFWEHGYDDLELGKQVRNPNGTYGTTPWCQCWQDSRAWGDNWRVAFVAPGNMFDWQTKNSGYFSMGQNNIGGATLVVLDAKGNISITPGARCNQFKP
jgi:hypothetical protein